jgi:hypothetical protein
VGVDDHFQIVVVAEVPLAIFVPGVLIALCQSLAQLDDIHAGIAGGGIDGFDKIVGELEVVDQSAISNGTVQDFQLFTEHVGFLMTGVEWEAGKGIVNRIGC